MPAFGIVRSGSEILIHQEDDRLHSKSYLVKMKIEFDNQDYGTWLKDWLHEYPVEQSFTLNYLHKCTIAELFLTTEPHLLISTTVKASQSSRYPLGIEYTLVESDNFDCGAYEFRMDRNLEFLKYDQTQ